MKSDKKQVFADTVYFDLVYCSEKKRENSNRGQKMSAEVCQRFLYSLPSIGNGIVVAACVDDNIDNFQFLQYFDISYQLWQFNEIVKGKDINFFNVRCCQK